MKHISAIVSAVLAVAGLVSCERDFEMTKVSSEGAFTAPTVLEVGDVVVDRNNNKVESVTFNWTDASFGAPVQIEYSLYLTYEGAQVLAGRSFTNSLTISKGDLNSFACSDLGVGKNVTATLGAYVVAALYGTKVSSVRSGNDISFNITTFDAPKSSIFLPGFYNGWNNAKGEFWETEGGSKIYRTLVAFSEDPDNTAGFCPFKLFVGGSWLGYNDGYEPEWGRIFENNDGNWAVPVGEEINILTVDLNKKTGTRETVSAVGLIGSFAESGGWASDVLFTYDPDQNVWATPVITLTSSDEFLLRLNGSWDAKYKYGDATVKSSEVEGGFELVNSGEAANIKSPGDGSYIVKLYANHTPFVIAYEKQ